MDEHIWGKQPKPVGTSQFLLISVFNVLLAFVLALAFEEVDYIRVIM
jgi:hypothetical protein